VSRGFLESNDAIYGQKTQSQAPGSADQVNIIGMVVLRT
jgi:hypothetical protein